MSTANCRYSTPGQGQGRAQILAKFATHRHSHTRTDTCNISKCKYALSGHAFEFPFRLRSQLILKSNFSLNLQMMSASRQMRRMSNVLRARAKSSSSPLNEYYITISSYTVKKEETT